MDNIVWLIMICVILCVIGWGSLLASCYGENKKSEESLLLGV